ncbi:MAG TPA: hypothetical protein VMK65_05625 [Longimicrobiales bacterium]|nr:hypothetical protein [Longimicrobiales bacterium]
MPYLVGSLLVVSGALVLALILSLRALPRGARCPACAGEALPLRSRVLTLLCALPLPGRARLRVRWCPRCGWQGLMRAEGAPAVRAAAAAPARPGRDALPVRSIRLSGAPWDVRLRCWHQDGVWLGRLLFVSPAGRVWTDARPGFCGTSISGVIGQAASLSEPDLAGRLEQLISE